MWNRHDYLWYGDIVRWCYLMITSDPMWNLDLSVEQNILWLLKKSKYQRVCTPYKYNQLKSPVVLLPELHGTELSKSSNTCFLEEISYVLIRYCKWKL